MAVVVVILVAALSGGFLWLRDSSLVAVDHVTVTGVSGPDAPQIRSALVAAARTMSTLDVNVNRLRTAVAPYPVVRDLRVGAQLPHGLQIHVVEQAPVAVISLGGRPVPVAADGTLLHDSGPPPPLPVLELRAPPGGPRLTERDATSALDLLAAAPARMLPRLSQVSHDGTHGLAAQLRGGPVIYFGDTARMAAKWRAAIAVLADPGSAGAVYIDVTDPQRPAAGAGTGAVAAAGIAGAPAASATGTGATAASTGTPGAATGSTVSGGG